ncbi:AAA family ATPase [Streptomyces sp. NPDC053560]|uniref:AAA family ATPase n=1 Tax=Streptomyces sp. NPDC053560 TaxID=3365711 RepID=UPI0037D7B9E5
MCPESHAGPFLFRGTVDSRGSEAPQGVTRDFSRGSAPAGLGRGSWGWCRVSGRAERTIFLGRADEVSSMHTRLRRAASSEPQIVVVEGPAGIGKTCLVRRFLADVPPDSCLLLASGEENETQLPYAVVSQLLAHLTVEFDPLLEALEPRARSGADVPDAITVGRGCSTSSAGSRSVRHRFSWSSTMPTGPTRRPCTHSPSPCGDSVWTG